MKNKIFSTSLIVILVLLAIIAGALLAYKYVDKSETEIPTKTETVYVDTSAKQEPLVVQQKQVQIFKGKDRPIAVMIDNNSKAWPQANLSKAYLVYEIVVEGGETRLMAVFKGQDLEKIGPIRSSRHYFLDYALENDAIYVHHGWSPQAQSDIPKLGINNINGIQESSKDFWRVKDKSSPHNMFTTMSSLLKIAERKGYETTSSKESILNYVAEEFDLSSKYKSEDIEAESTIESPSISEKTTAITAKNVTIPHSKLQTVKYEYNEQTKTYTRYARKKLQTDYIKNIGTFDGYYITNGKAIKIKCTKTARNKQTVYRDLEGNEIDVNDGNTFINICPINAEIVIE